VGLYYIGTVVLGMTREEFWHTTLRKLSALYAHHVRLRAPRRRRASAGAATRSPFDDLI
jgi:hypothetical protein